MQEIKCPKCGEVFKVDENEYASIVSQIKEKEVKKEVKEKLKKRRRLCASACWVLSVSAQFAHPIHDVLELRRAHIVRHTVIGAENIAALLLHKRHQALHFSF